MAEFRQVQPAYSATRAPSASETALLMLLNARQIAALVGRPERSVRTDLQRLGAAGVARREADRGIRGRPPWVIELDTYLRLTGCNPVEATGHPTLLDARQIAALISRPERTVRARLRRLGAAGVARRGDGHGTRGRPPWVIEFATFLRVTGIHPDDAAQLLARTAA